MEDFLEPDDICYTIQHEIAPLIDVGDFEPMYSDGGRPPHSPKVLLLVLIMQYLERLSDRAAATNLRFRIDWKIAFGLELEFEGIHPTSLVYFRERLLENERATYAFDKVLSYLCDKGLIRKKGKQRIDSTHVVGLVKELSRLEKIHETLRLFCLDVQSYKAALPLDVLRGHVDLYVEKIPTRGITDIQLERMIKDAGTAMQGFLKWVESLPDKEIAELKSFTTLREIFNQIFVVTNAVEASGDAEKIEIKKYSHGDDIICSPHETESRFYNKGSAQWVGYRAQIAETVGGEDVNFITYAEVTSAKLHDCHAVDPFLNDQESKKITPGEVFGDTHYNSSANIESSEKRGVALKGPVKAAPNSVRNPENKNFTVIGLGEKVICPQGHESEKILEIAGNRINACFPAVICGTCPRRDVCKPHARGKRISIRLESELLHRRRALMKTPEYKTEMHQRNGIEGTISGLVRGQGMRRCRFRGMKKTQMQIKFCGAAANISRLHRKRELDRAKAR